jgi:uncharacterized protein YigE (DUF2233 family)
VIRISALALLAIASASAADLVEQSVEHSGVKFRVVRISPDRIRLVWKNAQGSPYRSFDRVQKAFATEGKSVKFLTNAGIFEPGGIPSGLHIQDAKRDQPINLADAPGNFFLKPNGVCSFSTGKNAGAFVGTSELWLARNSAGVSELWAVQSGPILLMDGNRHPAFKKDSTSKLTRNGVGLDDQGALVFAITTPGHLVNFWDFAGLFLELGCKNALFLDGDISQMTVNPTQPVTSNSFGAMFVVAE